MRGETEAEASDSDSIDDLKTKLWMIWKWKRVDEANEQAIYTAATKSKKKHTTAPDEEGHFIKHDPKIYKSKVGKSDMLKPGQHDPFAYIKLNPKMLNKRN